MATAGDVAVFDDTKYPPQHPQGTVVAYADNSAIIEGAEIPRFYPGKTTYTVMRRSKPIS